MSLIWHIYRFPVAPEEGRRNKIIFLARQILTIWFLKNSDLFRNLNVWLLFIPTLLPFLNENFPFFCFWDTIIHVWRGMNMMIGSSNTLHHARMLTPGVLVFFYWSGNGKIVQILSVLVVRRGQWTIFWLFCDLLFCCLCKKHTNNPRIKIYFV